MSHKALCDAVDILNGISGPQAYSVARLLALAAQGAVRLTVELPGDFILAGKNHEDLRPRQLPEGFTLCGTNGLERPYVSRPHQILPSRADHFCIDRRTAYQLMRGRETVDLTSVLNFKPDGSIDEYRAATPYLQVSTANLLIERGELDRLIRETKASAASLTDAQSPASSATGGQVCAELTTTVGVNGAMTNQGVDGLGTEINGGSSIHRIKSREDILESPIEEAIRRAGTEKTSTVYVVLREMALESFGPFTGDIDGSALRYTNAKNELDTLTKDALDSRLRRRRKAAQNGVSRR